MHQEVHAAEVTRPSKVECETPEHGRFSALECPATGPLAVMLRPESRQFALGWFFKSLKWRRTSSIRWRQASASLRFAVSAKSVRDHALLDVSRV